MSANGCLSVLALRQCSLPCGSWDRLQSLMRIRWREWMDGSFSCHFFFNCRVYSFINFTFINLLPINLPNFPKSIKPNISRLSLNIPWSSGSSDIIHSTTTMWHKSSGKKSNEEKKKIVTNRQHLDIIGK